MEMSIDLNKQLSENPATFYIKVKGNSMIDAGIDDKDVLVVDRSLEPQNNKIAICFIDGEFTVKRMKVERLFVSHARKPKLSTHKSHRGKRTHHLGY
jgi:DNA polymerase V